MRKLTFLFQLFSKFRENAIWPMKAKSTISAKIFFRETLWGLYIKTDSSAYFWRRDNRFFEKTIIWRKVTWITKSREFSRVFGQKWNLFIAPYNWWKVHTVILRKYYVTMTNIMWLWKYYEYVSTKTFKIEM